MIIESISWHIDWIFFLVFITKSTNANLFLNFLKISSKRKLQQIASNHSPDVELKYSIKLYKQYINEPFSFSVSDAILSSDKPLGFRKNLQNYLGGNYKTTLS